MQSLELLLYRRWNGQQCDGGCHGSHQKGRGLGIPTVKPWNVEMVREKMALVKDAGAFAAAMDIDAAGLPF